MTDRNKCSAESCEPVQRDSSLPFRPRERGFMSLLDVCDEEIACDLPDDLFNEGAK